MELILVLQSIYLSYGSYTCVTELILVFRILFVYYGTYTCITELILVLQSIYLSYESYTCVTKLILVFRTLFVYYGTYTYTKVPVGITHIRYTEVLVGTTGIIFILQKLHLYYRYGSTRRYYRDFTCTKVLAGTTNQIQRYP